MVRDAKGDALNDGQASDSGTESQGEECEGEESAEGAEGAERGKAKAEYPGGAEEWDEILVCPLEIRFTQDKIHPFFYRRGPIVNVVPKIRAVQSSEGDLDLIPPFAPIHCLQKAGELWSMDNRRLYALQLAAMELWPKRCRVRCLSRERLPRHKFKTQYRKFNTTSEGRSIGVCTRYQQFDTWNWHERAVEVEWYSLSKRLGVLLSIFEATPVVGALLFRTGLTGFESRQPLILAFLLAFALDFVRQQAPVFERKLCDMQVRAIMDGETLVPWGSEQGMCMVQLAASMAVALLLLLPYLLGIGWDKLRSSLLSCWLGVAFMLCLQLATALRSRGTEPKPGLPLGSSEHNTDVAEEEVAELPEK